MTWYSSADAVVNKERTAGSWNNGSDGRSYQNNSLGDHRHGLKNNKELRSSDKEADLIAPGDRTLRGMLCPKSWAYSRCSQLPQMFSSLGASAELEHLTRSQRTDDGG